MKALIVAKTRMGSGACIGAIGENHKSLRLVHPAPDTTPNFNYEYEIGDLWELQKYSTIDDRPPPHVEDIVVHEKKRLKPLSSCVPTIRAYMPPKSGGLDQLFDGLTQATSSGSLFIAERTGVPSYSTMFWQTDKPLKLSARGKRLRYIYPSNGTSPSITYVGFQDPVEEIPAGSIIRVSLAHWWRPEDQPEQELRCYVQLSGWFDPSPPPPPGPIEEPDENTCDIDKTLREVFGLHQFRPHQREIIKGTLENEDALVVMPTGGGKSLCYQLPAYKLEGVAVVVSPLISLMADQVDALTARGIPATYLNSTIDHQEYVERQNGIRDNRYRLVYMAPETLVRPETEYLLKNAKLTLFAIDEAHCISEWGPDFRPEYRQLGAIRNKLPSVPCIALTATATPRVQKDILSNLGIDTSRCFVGSLDRSNLFIEVRDKLQDSVQQVIDFVRKHDGESGIVYCSTRDTVEELCASLSEHDIAALPYHGGMVNEDRETNQRRFVRDDVQVMVATIAFGMGIDKSNIRFVIHYNLPDSLDKYYQQIGRSGRDGVQADCLLLYDPLDENTIRYLISQQAPQERQGSRYRFRRITNWIKTNACRRKLLLEYFGEQYKADDCGMCDNCKEIAIVNDGDDDITVYARLFLTCVRATEQRFGRGHNIQILLGSKAKSITKWGHEKLQVYGKGKIVEGTRLSRTDWNQLVDQFIQQKLLSVGDYKVLTITDRGRAVLKGEPVRGKAPTVGRRRQVTRRVANTGNQSDKKTGLVKINNVEVSYDMVLLAKLKVLRKAIADRSNMPPYTVFSDTTLLEMAAYRPTTFLDFRDLHGVGDYKTSKYGEEFLAVISEHIQSNENEDSESGVASWDGSMVDAPELRPRTREVVACYLKNQSTVVAGEKCGIKPVTVAGHLLKYVQAGYSLPLTSIVEESTVPKEHRLEIFHFFDKSRATSPVPIYRRYNGEISHGEIMLLQLWYLLEQHRSNTETV